MESEANIYSRQWFEFFHFGIDETRTIRETEFVYSCAPRPEFQKILDLWNPEFFKAHQGERALMVSKGVVRENKRVTKDRLVVWLDYPEGAREQFEWQLFTPEQMEQLASSVGLGLLVSCTDFEMTTLPSPANPRIQFLLETLNRQD